MMISAHPNRCAKKLNLIEGLITNDQKLIQKTNRSDNKWIACSYSKIAELIDTICKNDQH